MMDFPYEPVNSIGGYAYRPLKLADPLLRGWDVYALQTALNATGADLDPDGVFGKLTRAAVVGAQKRYGLTVDGIAGIATQRALGQAIVKRKSGAVSYERLFGSVEHECGWQLGNFTPIYANNGSRDRGACQENSAGFPDAQHSFGVPKAIDDLIARILSYHKKYRDRGVVDKLAWDAAQGSWNAPLYADRYAMGESNVPDSFRAYIAAVTAYV